MMRTMEPAAAWPACGAPARIYLVAVERETFPPLAFGNSVLQRMRVTMAPPAFPPEPDCAAPVPLRTLDSPARPIRGEILRDAHGRYYEKTGNVVRELGRLEASPGGDLVEVEPEAAPSRKLFPDPGQWRVLRWGEFRGLLAAQIAHPERLRDEHRLPCYVQVIDAGAREPVTDLAKAMFGDADVGRQLIGLTHDAAARLELLQVLPPPRRRPPQAREPGVVLPGDRLFRVTVAGDPTADAPPEPPSKKREIPEPFASQPFARTRDDVLLEMRMPPRPSERLSAWARSLFARSTFDRWLRTLWGKSPDDQLWAAAPPPGMLSDSAVREWAAATLEMAGYDPAMLREWEIYWRRRGY